MNSNILQNVRNYCFARNPINFDKLNKYRICFQSKSSVVLLNIFLAFILSLNLYFIMDKCFSAINEINIVNYAILDIIIFFSVHYIYKQAECFMRMFSGYNKPYTLLYYILLIIGIVASILSITHISYWAFYLGIEVAALGIFYILLYCKKMLPKYSKDYFIFHGGVFVVIGFVICILNVVVDYVFNSINITDINISAKIMLPWLLIFLIYIFMSNISHINKNNMAVLIGNVSSEDHIKAK